jgi:hypothetical protein
VGDVMQSSVPEVNVACQEGERGDGEV